MPSHSSPLQVYLDSSDFSNLSHPVNRLPFVDVERRLIAWRNAGLIELRFSFAHVAEMAPMAPAHIDLARLRAECIVRLCGNKTLIAEGDVISAEVRAWTSRTILDRCQVQNNEGIWFPTQDPTVFDFPSVEDLLLEGAGGIPLSPTAWNRFRQQIFDQHGQLLPQFRIEVLQRVPDLIKELRLRLPMSKAAVNAVKDYFLGQKTKQVVLELLLSSTKDLRLFVDWYAINWTQVSPLTTWLRDAGSNHAKAMMEQRQKLERLFEGQRSLGHSNRQIQASASKEMNKMRQGLLRSSVQRLTGIADSDIDEVGAFKFMPGVATAAYSMIAVAGKTLTPSKNPREADSSDLGDRIHSLYLPYVDVFRTDSFAAQELKSLNLPYKTTVVGNLIDLPSAIEARLG